MITVAISVMLAVVSCRTPNTNEPEPNPDPIPNPQEPATGELVIPEAIMRPDVLTPVDYQPDFAEGGMDGVTIEITEKSTDNFKFTVQPGANIQSYRLDVYPLCRLYNSLYESMRSNGLDMNTQLSDEQVDRMIRDYIFDSQGAGAYTFSVDNLNDFLRHEFDWMNTPYAQAKVVPDCEYVIAAVGCFDKDGYEEGDMSLCYVRTPYKQLIGSPAVELDVLTSYSAMQITYLPNEDCKYFYQWCSNESDLQPYIDTYGEKLYSDFMRNAVYDPTSSGDTENSYYYLDFGSQASAEVPIMATAVGLDGNYTPSPEFQSEVFTLRKRPANTEPAYSKISVNENYIGATTFWLDVELGANCSAAVMKVLTKEEAEVYQGYSAEQLQGYATTIYEDGWGFSNWNYSYNLLEDKLLGSGSEYSEAWVNCSPDTEYVIAWTAMNQYKELAPVQFTDVIKTKAIVKDAPETSQEDAVLTLTHDGVQKVKIRFDYSFEKTSKIHFQYIAGIPYMDEAGNLLDIPTEAEGTREEFVKLLFDGLVWSESADKNISVLVNSWWTEPRGVESFTDILEPNTTYTIAYIAEDWNGVLGNVKFATTTTDALVGGDDPQMQIVGGEDASGSAVFNFSMIKDAWAMKTAVCSTDDSSIGLADIGTARLPYKEAVKVWSSFVLNYGIERLSSSSTENARGFCVALGMAIGGTTSEPVYGPMEHLIYAEGEFRTLEYYYPGATSSVAAKSAMYAVRQQMINDVHRPVGYVPSSELPEVEYGVRAMDYDAFMSNDKMIVIDYHKLSAHPLASGR